MKDLRVTTLEKLIINFTVEELYLGFKDSKSANQRLMIPKTETNEKKRDMSEGGSWTSRPLPS